jgi:hypothetical protein
VSKLNRRILLSLLTIGVVGIAGVSASRAFFSDKAVSKGNIIKAGTLNLTIDSEAHYDGLVCNGETLKWQRENTETPSQREDLIGQPCEGTWPLRDLTTEKFFNLSDVKPGDEGENIISLHVDNPAWACVRIDNMTTTHPEADLAKGLYFTAWGDTNCNNKFDENEQLLFSNKMGPASDVLNGKTYALADSTTPFGPLMGSDDPELPSACIGLRWCAGTMTITDHTITCDGASLGNEAQGDSVSADITFDVVQSRNNLNFRCAQTQPVYDYLNIGDTDSESGHNLDGWSQNQVGLFDGTNYGGGSSDKSFRLLMGPGDPLVCADGARPATFTMNAGAGHATKLTLEHLDGIVNDSFDVKVNGILAGHYTAGGGGGEHWVFTPFPIVPPATGVVNVELDVTNPATDWCNTWGQVAFSNAKLE